MDTLRRVTAAVTILLLGPATAADAAAGTYVVESCRTANGAAGAQSWVARPVPAAAKPTSPLFTDGCASDGHVRFEIGPLIQQQVTAAQWLFEAPAGTSIARLDVWRYAAVYAPEQPARYRLFADERVLEESPDLPTWEIGGVFAGALVSAPVLDAQRVGVQIGCEEGDYSCAGDAIQLGVTRAAVTLRDEVSPEAVGSPSGRLFSGLSIDGLVDGRLGFRDVGGGVATVELRVDGTARGVQHVGGASCAPPYVVRVPCAAAGSATLTLDASQLSDGAHTVELVMSDVAGNRGVAGPYAISVRTPPPAPSGGPVVAPSPPSSPAPAAVQPPGTLALAGKPRRRVRFVEQKLAGSVRSSAGGAIARARVEVTTRPLRGGAWSAPTFVTADAGGRFAVTLPRGPSREVRVAYGDSAQTVKLIVAAPVRFTANRKATRNGRSVRFSGTVPGTGGARTRVELQAWAGRWVPFATAGLRNGRFGASYRFRSTYATTRYRFRAVLHGDDDFPYAGGTSPEVEVVVRP
ncbi:hypothetical protein C8N24_1914 [Solirubrobacter pauli]|uniref:Ig-like domain-containing protein n=1 Tax=Solirubrobacter pauli TaxID=166793 RepID=A0A660LCU4_9ACTN|nr:hypothetical protein [Solirubrobacter pauli]RKQ92075.1 hypothetical protein C8N24_1914 [Solirubrobacter pauli]